MLYNWSKMKDRFHDQARIFSVEDNDDAFDNSMQTNMPNILVLINQISSLKLWEGVKINNDDARQRGIIIDLLCTMIMAVSTPILENTELIPSPKAIEATLKHFAGRSTEDLYLHISETMKLFLDNVNDILGEFYEILQTSRDMGYMDSIKSMYLAGIFIGSAIVWGMDSPDVHMVDKNNIFMEYTQFLQTTFDDMNVK